MEVSLALPGAHVTPAPSGLLLACIIGQTLRICYARAPEQSIDFQIRCPADKVRSLSWAQDSSKVLILSSANVELVNLEDDKDRVRIDNGTGGFGRFERAELIGRDMLFTLWEYGRGRLWDLVTGRTQDIEIKTLTSGKQYAIRNAEQQDTHTFAYISRPGADDLLSISVQGANIDDKPTKMPTIDAQSVVWSPDGNWIAVVDSPQHSPGLFLFTADGHLFRSFSRDPARESTGLGVKALTWSPDSRYIALSDFNGRVEIISPRTMSSIATIHHPTTLNQMDFEQSVVWQETASATGDRDYTATTQTVSPPLSQKAPSDDPQKLGIMTAVFSPDNRILASIDGRMLSTIWIWDVELMQTKALAIQHSNIRKVSWHASLSGLLLLDCGENKAYLWEVLSDQPPTCLDVHATSTLSFSFMPCQSNSSLPAILAASRDSFTIVHPYGRGGSAIDGDSIFEALAAGQDTTFDESVTQRIAQEAELNDGTARLDDTFDIARRKHGDSFDDSEIF